MPDIAYITLGARTRASDAQSAAKNNANVSQRIQQAIKRLGIPDADIKTAQYTIQPVFEYPPNASPRLTGYEATNLIKVTAHDLTQVSSIIDVAVNAGANVVQDVSFSLRNEADVRAKALTEAIEDGKNKAQVMAKALGVRIGRLINASEASAPIVVPYLARSEAGAATPTPISPGQISVRASVNLVYDIVQ
jgi:uncharacterized protein YggE